MHILVFLTEIYRPEMSKIATSTSFNICKMSLRCARRDRIKQSCNFYFRPEIQAYAARQAFLRRARWLMSLAQASRIPAAAVKPTT